MTELEIYKRCLSLGMTKAGAAGCTANILAESAGNPINVENRCPMSDEEYSAAVDNGSYEGFVDDRYGYGLCQWTLPSRKQKYLDYFQGHGVSIGDVDTQFQFMAREMREDYIYVWSILTHTNDPYEAAYVMCMQYERPANTEASSDRRGNQANDIYERCKNAEVRKVPYDPQKVIDIAVSQLGYHEKNSNNQLDDFSANPGNQNWNKFARDLDALGTFYNGRKNIGPNGLWCDIFVDWCFVEAYGRAGAQYLLCQPDRSAGAGCSFSAGYFRDKGQFHINNPKPGDQIFFGTGPNNVWHTGLVVEVTDSRVITIEGNTSDQVARRSYVLSDSSIYGYGRPNWGVEEFSVEIPSTSPSAPIDIPIAPTTIIQMCSPRIPLLKPGMNSGYVRAAQVLLGERGFYCGGHTDHDDREIYDGEFGPATESAVKEFQKKSHLEVDGEIGANTWAALLNL